MLAVLGFLYLVSAALAANHHTHTTAAPTTTAKPKTDHELVQELYASNKMLERNVEDLTRQVMLQQTYVEERIRSDGSSGLKQVRNHHEGTRPYYTSSTSAGGVAGLHEHANNIRTVGMGELNVVLNGVEFRTRHNDYRLRQPTHDTVYNHVTDIKYPDVPPEVLAKHTVAEQITEMREWFKAFKAQDHSVRDYRKYFKPVLTYMEGGWTTNTKTLEEPFFSDRHHIDASSWFDLQDKVRFSSYTGGKSRLENFAYLPTTIMNMHNATPEYAQWNYRQYAYLPTTIMNMHNATPEYAQLIYRIVAHPLTVDVPIKAFGLVDDLTERMKKKISMATLNNTRVARYSLSHKVQSRRRETAYEWGFLDDLMYQIPGKDNYGANLKEDAMGDKIMHIHSTTTNIVPLNTARYHRIYKVEDKDAMGQTHVHRSFADPNCFFAQTTSPHIAPLEVTTCKKVRDPHHPHRYLKAQNCTTYTERYTWAIPLEIVYMTPLLTWNPHHLHHVHATSGPQIYNIVHGPNGTRNGALTQDKAYNGTHDKLYYRTPAEFYTSGNTVDHDRADTAKGVVGVMDPHGTIHKMVASGNRIILPTIDGVGKIRTRWPIVPLHAEGEQTRKELEALKDMVMKMPTYASLFEELPTSVAKANSLFMEQEHQLQVPQTTRDPPGLHGHDIPIHQFDIESMKKNHVVHGLLTSVDNGHQHTIDVKMVNGSYVMTSCDGLPRCWDGHDIHLKLEF